MSGSAKQQFQQLTGRSPWKRHASRRPLTSWPLIEMLLNDGRLSYIDYALASQLVKDQSASEDVVIFLCFLSLAAREGYLCLETRDYLLNPSPRDLFRSVWLRDLEDSQMGWEDDLLNLEDKVRCGLITLPSTLFTDSPLEDSVPSTPLCMVRTEKGVSMYLQRYWLDVMACLKHLRRLTQCPPTITIDVREVDHRLSQLCESQSLLPEQAEAIRQACSNSVTIISGGPGTGKTYTAGWLLKILWEGLTSQQQENFEAKLAAPTGKAATNLQGSFSRAVASTALEDRIASQTLHRLLSIKRGGRSTRNTPSPLTADVIIIDESSMIDLHMMSLLLERVKSGSRLIFLGDPHQLPPVESGAIFSEMLSLMESKHLSGGAVQLKTCLRAELQGILQVAEAIKTGNADEVMEYLTHKESQGVSLSPLEKPETLVAAIAPLFPGVVGADAEPLDLLRCFQRFRVLTPLRKGPFGVETLNALLARRLLRSVGREATVAVPIIVTANDDRLGLCNGESGIVLRRIFSGERHLLAMQEGDVAYFLSEGGKVKALPAILLPKVELAFCLSVHKSQGSEFDHVIMVMPEGAEIFGRALLYTGVTRAKRKLELLASGTTIRSSMAAGAQGTSTGAGSFAVGIFNARGMDYSRDDATLLLKNTC